MKVENLIHVFDREMSFYKFRKRTVITRLTENTTQNRSAAIQRYV